jgi:hypothetical protein
VVGDPLRPAGDPLLLGGEPLPAPGDPPLLTGDPLPLPVDPALVGPSVPADGLAVAAYGEAAGAEALPPSLPVGCPPLVPL